jgi:formiminotetrahydrofolate cyclodeaminase
MTDADRLADLTVRELGARLASADPIPGGGSAAALAGVLAASLVKMVVELTHPANAAEPGESDALREIGLAASEAQSELLNLADLDANAYAAVVRARRLPREAEADREARRVQIVAATQEATRVPLRTAEVACAVLELAERIARTGNRNAISDAGVAAQLAAAAVHSAALNVRINLPALPPEDPLRAEATDRIDELRSDADLRLDRVLAVVAERMG